MPIYLGQKLLSTKHITGIDISVFVQRLKSNCNIYIGFFVAILTITLIQFNLSCRYDLNPLISCFCRRIHYSPTTLGIENVIAGTFKNSGYRVLNPCLLLKIYHLHCAGVHVVRGGRINKNKKYSYTPRPVNKLE